MLKSGIMAFFIAGPSREEPSSVGWSDSFLTKPRSTHISTSIISLAMCLLPNFFMSSSVLVLPSSKFSFTLFSYTGDFMEGTLWLAWVLSVQGPHLLGFVVVVVTPALNGEWLITIY